MLADLELEKPAVEIERWVDLVDLVRDVVDADEAWAGHAEPPGSFREG
jgi:hypothetical protein